MTTPSSVFSPRSPAPAAFPAIAPPANLTRNGTLAAGSRLGRPDHYERPKPYRRPGFEAPLANGIPFRIMCLGASTSRGDTPTNGSDGNGFRRPLRQRLTSIGNMVNFVGTQHTGNMTDNEVEAYPGMRVGVVHQHARRVVPRTKPNLFLLNDGSNDAFQHFDLPRFYVRYDALVRYLLEASPRAAVVMATLLPTTDRIWKGRDAVLEVNRQLRRLGEIYRRQGRPVVLVDMAAPDGIQDETLAADGMHPNLAGYEMMARILFEGLLEADARGFLQPPEPLPDIPDDGEDGKKSDLYELYWAVQHEKEDERRRVEEDAIRDMEEGLARAHAPPPRKEDGDGEMARSVQ